MDAIKADALAFGAFSAGGAAMSRRLGGVGTSLTLGGAAGAVEPANSLGERAGNLGMGMATFGLDHGVTSGVGALRNRLVKAAKAVHVATGTSV